MKCVKLNQTGTQAAAAALALESEPTFPTPNVKVRMNVLFIQHISYFSFVAESKMYQIEVLTTSESQETRIVRFNPQAVQRAVEDSLKNQIQVR
jgi:hypothetical protein